MANKDYFSALDVLKLDGHSEIVGTPTVKTLMVDSDGDVLFATGATKPTDTDAGYAHGCIFIVTGGGTATTFYVNMSSNTSADFNPIYQGAAA